jgi:hypothetical protein
MEGPLSACPPGKKRTVFFLPLKRKKAPPQARLFSILQFPFPAFKRKSAPFKRLFLYPTENKPL